MSLPSVDVTISDAAAVDVSETAGVVDLSVAASDVVVEVLGAVPGQVDPDAIEAAVEDYLTENPPSGASSLPALSDVDDDLDPVAGQVLGFDGTEWTATTLQVLEAMIRFHAPVAFAGGSITGDTATVAAFSGVPAGRHIFLVGQTNSADDGFWLSQGGGTFSRALSLAELLTPAAGYHGALVLIASDVEHDAVATSYRVELVAPDTLELVRQDYADAADFAAVEAKVDRHWPSTAGNVICVQSKWLTWDPDFPTDGTATHIGGDELSEDNGFVFVANNANGKGGPWIPHLGSAWERPGEIGLGSLLGDDIGNYDRISFSTLGWPRATEWVMLQADPSGGRSLDDVRTLVPMDHNFHVNLIATTRDGTELTVMEHDGSTTAVDLAETSDTGCVLVLDDLTMVTYDDGAVVQVEDFGVAHGTFSAIGVDGDGVGTVVDLNPEGGSWVRLSNGDSEGGGSGPDLSDDVPQPLSTADPGESTEASRSDHVHALPTPGDIGAAEDGHDHDAAYAAIGHNHDSAYQPLDSDLTAIAGVSTQSYGRGLLALPDAAALRASAEVIRSDRLAAVGTQSTIANATAIGAANGALLLDSDLALPVLAAGDVIEFRAIITLTNSSGGARIYYPALLLGSTNIVGSQNLSIPETTSLVKVEGSISVASTSSQIVEASLGSQGSNSQNSIGRVLVQTTEDVSSAKAFNVGIRTNVSADTQTAQILFFNAWRRRA